jgi:hypothetical protein
MRGVAVSSPLVIWVCLNSIKPKKFSGKMFWNIRSAIKAVA